MGMIALGMVAWVLASVLVSTKPYEVVKSLPLGQPSLRATIPVRDIYKEVLEWAKVIGQILAGAGSVAGAVRALIALFKRKN